MYTYNSFLFNLEPKLSSGENSTLSSASCLVDLRKSEKSGNFVVAKDNIRAGDVLLVEKPVVSNLLTKFYGTHCLHCFNR